jgi:hypothetical protein
MIIEREDLNNRTKMCLWNFSYSNPATPGIKLLFRGEKQTSRAAVTFDA